MLPHFNEAEEQYSIVKINRWLHSLDESSQSKYSNIIDDFAAFIPIKQQGMPDNPSYTIFNCVEDYLAEFRGYRTSTLWTIYSIIAGWLRLKYNIHCKRSTMPALAPTIKQ